MKTPIEAILCFVTASILGAVGQFFYKFGTDHTTHNLMSYVFNWRILAGVACHIVVMTLFVAAFKVGGQPSVLYPIYATTFIWAALIGWSAFGTAIKPVHIGGMSLLVAGMYLMGR